MEVHIMKKFKQDFYGSILRIVMLGYIRPETDFKSLQDLIDTINNDIEVANKELEKPENEMYCNHEFFKEPLEKKSDCNHNQKD